MLWLSAYIKHYVSSDSHHSQREPISDNNKIYVVDVFLSGSVDEKVFVTNSVHFEFLFIYSYLTVLSQTV